jgi:hypothetical protein
MFKVGPAVNGQVLWMDGGGGEGDAWVVGEQGLKEAVLVLFGVIFILFYKK